MDHFYRNRTKFKSNETQWICQMENEEAVPSVEEAVGI